MRPTLLPLLLASAAFGADAALPSAPNAQPVATVSDDQGQEVDLTRAKPTTRPQANTSPWFSANADLYAGYDSNVLLNSGSTPEASEQSSSAIGADVRLLARALSGENGRLNFTANAGGDDYQSVSEAQMVRYGLGAAASWSLGGWDPGVAVSWNAFRLDQEAVARVLAFSPYLAKVWQWNVGVLSFASQSITYNEDDPGSGSQYDFGYRHWFLLEESNINRRIEVGLRGGMFKANEEDNDYRTMVPAVSWVYRFSGDRTPTYGTLDFNGGLTYEGRTYADPAAGGSGEKQTISSLRLGLDAWMCANASVGPYVGYSNRSSSESSDNEYTRYNAGLKLATTW